MPSIKVGVFDSGIGGQSVVNALKKQLPNLEVIFKCDNEHFPYGNRSVNDIYEFTKPIIQNLIDEGCRVIVIACNTVTTNLITKLREEFNVPFIGMEPMVKPAAKHTESGIIAVCATPRTLASNRYKWLKVEYAKNIKVLEPDCSNWATMVETQIIDRAEIAATIQTVCSQGADQIVLGCTHYHWIEEIIRYEAKNKAKVIQPETAVITQLQKVIKDLS